MRGFQSLRSRLVVWFLLAIVPLAGFGIFSHFHSRSSMRELVGNDFRDRAMSTADKISRNLFERYADIVDFAENPVVASSKSTGEQRSAVLANFVSNRSPVYTSIVFADTTGRVVAASDPVFLGANEAEAEWFLEGQGGDPYFSPSVYLDERVGGPVVAFAWRVEEGGSGRALGVLCARVDYGALFTENLAKKETFGKTGEILVVDRKSGLVLCSKDAAAVLKSNLSKQKAFQAALKSDHGFVTQEDAATGKEHAIGWATEQGFSIFPGQRVLVFVRQETSEAFRSLNELLLTFLVALGVAAAALGVPRVVGTDISPAATRITRENARDNGLAGSLQVVRGSTECLKGPFDLVIANLPWEVQMDKVSELDRLAAPGGRLILSGFRDNQEDLLLRDYQKLGWSLAQRLTKDFRHPTLPPDISFTWVAWWLEPKAFCNEPANFGS